MPNKIMKRNVQLLMVNNSTVPVLKKRTNASHLKSLNIFLNLNFHQNISGSDFFFFLHLLDAFCRIQNEITVKPALVMTSIKLQSSLL